MSPNALPSAAHAWEMSTIETSIDSSSNNRFELDSFLPAAQLCVYWNPARPKNRYVHICCFALLLYLNYVSARTRMTNVFCCCLRSDVKREKSNNQIVDLPFVAWVSAGKYCRWHSDVSNSINPFKSSDLWLFSAIIPVKPFNFFHCE